jgi:hypothetical protein
MTDVILETTAEALITGESLLSVVVTDIFAD